MMKAAMEAESIITDHPHDTGDRAFMQPSKKLALFAIVGLAAVFVLSVLLQPPPGDYFTVCGFKNLTGLPCPGCGLTHSFCALGKGALGDAFAYNAIGPPLFLTLLFVWIRSTAVLLNKSAVVSFFARINGRFKLVRAFAIAFAVYGAARLGYVLVYQPTVFTESPLSKLIARLIH